MSKERELLLLITKRFQEEFNNSEWYSEVDKQIIAEIDGLLAEPEQEPGAWFSLSDIEWMNIVNNKKILELINGRHNSEEAVNLAVKMTEEICKKKNSNSIPIPKQKPLSDEAICEILLKKEWKGFVELIRKIEELHGIGD